MVLVVYLFEGAGESDVSPHFVFSSTMSSALRHGEACYEGMLKRKLWRTKSHVNLKCSPPSGKTTMTDKGTSRYIKGPVV